MSQNNKSVADVNAILDLAIDNLLELTSENISEVEKEIIKKLNNWRGDFKINNQMMHLLEAPMSDLEFKDIIKQVQRSIFDDLLNQARSDGVITPQEQNLLDIVSKTIEI